MQRIIVIIVLLISTFILPGTITIDGTTRSYDGRGVMQFQVGKRSIALLLVPYRPGRMYYRCQVARLANAGSELVERG